VLELEKFPLHYIKKKRFSCVIKPGAACDVNENYSCAATGKKNYLIFNLSIVWLQIMIILDGKMPIYHFSDKCKKKYNSFSENNNYIEILNKI
jgi:hypothetical protein